MPAIPSAIEHLLEIMEKLRDPADGCPWDREQTFASIAPYTIEEAYEVEDAIRRQDWNDLRGELGDLLLQVVFHAQLAREAGHFEFEDVVSALADKLVRRHPHVFGDAQVHTVEQLHATWDAIKAQERASQAEDRGERAGALDGIAAGLPALTRAAKLWRRGERAGLIRECDTETPAALAARLRERPSEALGPLLLSCVAAACRAGLDPEALLREEVAHLERTLRARDTRAEETAGEQRSDSPTPRE